MKQQTSFGSTIDDGAVQLNLLPHGCCIHNTKEGEKLSFRLESDDATAESRSPGSVTTPGISNNNDNTLIHNQGEDDEDIAASNESEANDQIEEEIDSWLNYIRTDIKSLAMTLRNTAGGVAHFVHNTALTVVNEITSVDNDDNDVDVDESSVNDAVPIQDVVTQTLVNDDFEDIDAVSDAEVPANTNSDVSENIYPFCGSIKSPTTFLLPWEIKDTTGSAEQDDEAKSAYIDDVALKQLILLISQDEEIFTSTKQTSNDYNLVFDRNAFLIFDLIEELFKYDPQLLHVYTKFQFRENDKSTTKSMMHDDEKVFWYNYFQACTLVRNQYINETTSSTTSEIIVESVMPSVSDISLSREEAETCTFTGTMMTPHVMNDDDENGKNFDGCDDDESSYICLSESDDRSNIPKAPYSSGMRSIDSMVFVENESLTTTIPVPTAGSTTKTTGKAANFFTFFS